MIQLDKLGSVFRDTQRRKNAVYSCPVCGSHFVAVVSYVTAGRVKSCGCLQHGMSKSKEFSSWLAMRARCYYTNHIAYHNYGGRGITVCSRWLNSFPNFFADMGNKPDGTSLDRIDNDGNYCPKNCRWATATEQAKNNRDTVILVHNGRSHCLKEWSEITGIQASTLSYRYRSGWKTQDILETTPKLGNRISKSNDNSSN